MPAYLLFWLFSWSIQSFIVFLPINYSHPVSSRYEKVYTQKEDKGFLAVDGTGCTPHPCHPARYPDKALSATQREERIREIKRRWPLWLLSWAERGGVEPILTKAKMHIFLLTPLPWLKTWMKEVRDNTSREGGLPTLPGLYLCTFQPSQRGFFWVHTCVWREREPEPEFLNFYGVPGITSDWFWKHHLLLGMWEDFFLLLKLTHEAKSQAWMHIIYLSRVLCLSYSCLSSCHPVIVAERWAILYVSVIKLTKETKGRVSRGGGLEGQR
jgi:hypothetical protein